MKHLYILFSTDQLAVNSVTNLYIDNVTIRPKTTNTLAGLLAGYVSANISSCGVHYSNLDFSNGNTVIDSKKFNNKLSNYALIGDYNSSDYTWDGHTSESGNNWGGSIDTTTLVKRLYYIAGVSNVNSTTYSSNEAIDFDGKTTPSYNKDKYNAYFRSVNNGSLIWNSNSGTLQYLYKGTYLPLNIDTSIAFAGNEIDATASGVSNWKTTEYYKNHTSEYDLISDSNTGYIVGGGIPTEDGGSPTGKGAKYIYLRKEMNFSSNLSNSISSSEYDNDNVKIYTVDTVNGSTSTQITSSTGFQRYSTVKANFDTKMAVTKSYCYAIRFQSINATNSDNWSDKVTVKINGNEKSNYQFLNSTINFTVNKPGYITVIISSFMGVGTKMFDLFKIDRSSDNSISKVTQINKIYGVANSGTYYYDDTSKNSNLLFNFENTHSLNEKSLYYFEIPVNAGDYAIGKYSATEGTDTSTGYLNYLDIGANAGSSSGSGSGTKSGTIKNVSFYYYDGSTLKKVTEDGTDVVFDISGDGSAIFYFNRIKDTGVLYFDENVNGLTRTLGSNVSGASSLASDKTCTAKAS